MRMHMRISATQGPERAYAQNNQNGRMFMRADTLKPATKMVQEDINQADALLTDFYRNDWGRDPLEEPSIDMCLRVAEMIQRYRLGKGG